MSQSALNLHLYPKQHKALTTTGTEVLYGGAAGGGKSHLMRAASIIWCAGIPGLQVYLFRRIEADLKKNHVEGPKGYRSLLANWASAGLVEIIEDEIRFWNGSKIYLCHCKDEKHRFKYQGAEIHVLLIDELTHFSEVIYRYLRSRCRAPGLDLPEQYKGMFPRILCGSNPGNIGHLWVKQTFVVNDNREPRRTSDSEGGMLRQFIPAKIEDNPSIDVDQPDYRSKLRGLGSEALVRAMEDGDWDVIEGAYFDCWDAKKHVIRPFAVPDHWLRIRAFDWGSAKPFSYGEYAVSDGEPLPDGRQYPAGAMIQYLEWYGAQRDEQGQVIPDVGLKMTAEQVAAGIRDRAHGKTFGRSVADPAIFAEDGGPSIAERMLRAGVQWNRADNKRVSRGGAMGGWDQVRARLVGDDRPMLYFFDTCTEIIRTLPAIQHDELRPEDVDTNMEDHGVDQTRYACMTRPYVKNAPEAQPPIKVVIPTFNDIMKRHQRRR